jgi:hypothetical protein
MRSHDAILVAGRIARGEYEEALDLRPGASPETISRAHLRLLYRLRGQAWVAELVNRAKSALLEEGDLERGRRLFGLSRVHDALPFLEAGVGGGGAAAAEAEDHLILGQSLCHAQRFGDAAASLQRAIALRGTAEDYAWLAVAHERTFAWHEAEIAHRHVVALRGNADDVAALGQVLWAQGSCREAVEVLSCSAAMNPSGIAGELLGRYRAALWKARLGEVRRRCADTVRRLGAARIAITRVLFAIAVACLVAG